MGPPVVNENMDFMPGIAPNIPDSEYPQQIVQQHTSYGGANPGAHRTTQPEFDLYVDRALLSQPFPFEYPAIPDELGLPALVPAPGTRSTHSDLSSDAPETPLSPQTNWFQDNEEVLTSYCTNEDDNFLSVTAGLRTYTYNWVGDAATVSAGPDTSTLLSFDPRLGHQYYAYEHLSMQQHADVAGAGVYGYGRSDRSAPSSFSAVTSSSSTPSAHSPFYFPDVVSTLADMYAGVAPLDTMFGTTYAPELAMGTQAAPQDLATSFRPNEGTINPSLLHAAAPAYRSLGLGFHDQEQPQRLQPHDAATADAPGRGIGMQVSPSAYAPNHPDQHPLTQAAHFTSLVSDGLPRLGIDSCGPAEEDASKKRQTSQEKKHKCTLCPRGEYPVVTVCLPNIFLQHSLARSTCVYISVAGTMASGRSLAMSIGAHGGTKATRDSTSSTGITSGSTLESRRAK